MNTAEYIELLGSQKKTSVVDAVLMALFFDVILHVYYFDGTDLSKIEFNSDSKGKLVRLYLNAGGIFDVVYDKAEIKSAGICQSIILDVRPYNSHSCATNSLAPLSQSRTLPYTRTSSSNCGSRKPQKKPQKSTKRASAFRPRLSRSPIDIITARSIGIICRKQV